MNPIYMETEKALGLGYGAVSKESQQNLETAEELCRIRQPEKAIPYLVKAMEDDRNLDAYVQTAFLAPDLDTSVDCLEHAEMKGERMLKKDLGKNCFDNDGKGKFWAIPETRPYMRVLQALVRLSFCNKQYEKSANTIVKMLRLCPGDDLSQRKWLGSILIRTGRVEDTLSFAQEWLHPPMSDKDNIPLRGGTRFLSPSQEPLPESTERRLSEFCQDAIIYTAALSSFTLWGKCPLSDQYLRIAAKVNPTILMRILGRVRQPTELNMELARTLNGLGDAHDYLWLTQDLWMENDVWNWANGNQEGKQAILKICSRSGCENRETEATEFKRCSACREVSYCSPACQKAHWKTHKPKCLAFKQRKEIVRAVMRGKSVPVDSEGKKPVVASTDFFLTGDKMVRRAEFHS